MPFFQRYLAPSSWALKPSPSTLAPPSYQQWTNEDMDPVPPHRRTWSTSNYITYWISDAANAPTWQCASSMIAIGLSWRESLVAIAVAHVIISVVMVLNGTIGARLHVAFPLLNRSSFGFWFSYFSVVSRIILSMFWFGVQTYTGSECTYQMIKAIWPSTGRIPNRLPKDANITTVGMMCYIIFWLLQFPLMLVSPQRIKYLFLIKSIIVPLAFIMMLVWAMIRAPPRVSLEPQRATISGSDYHWAWLSAMNSALGIYATVAVNIPDFTRYAKSERAQYVQLAVIPVAFTFIAFCGIAVTSAGQVMFGETLWDPTKLIDRAWGVDNRAAAFFASFSFALASIGTNISANSLSAANDMMVIAPKWINIRRGQIICALIGGWAVCPWEILSKAQGFLSFMSGYTVFLGPFAGIMVTDYWLVHRCQVDVKAMYDPRGRYRYWKGTNWRAVVALLFSVFPSFPGLVVSINPSPGRTLGPVRHIFDIAWLYGFFAASAVYWVTSTLVPARETFVSKEEIEGYNDDSSSSKSDDDDREKVSGV
ncbi:NCS1 nucleoside transporter family [Marasmius fiardii PR-910]|nr:NCS1 nucleoside transporter family [Marasmius fiardii PR-910]